MNKKICDFRNYATDTREFWHFNISHCTKKLLVPDSKRHIVSPV